MPRGRRAQRRTTDRSTRHDRRTTRKSGSTCTKLPTSHNTLLRLQRKKPRLFDWRLSPSKSIRRDKGTRSRKIGNKMGRPIKSNQRNSNRSLRARKMQNWSPSNETLERLQLKEILQIVQTRTSTRSTELRAGRPPAPTAQ